MTAADWDSHAHRLEEPCRQIRKRIRLRVRKVRSWLHLIWLLHRDREDSAPRGTRKNEILEKTSDVTGPRCLFSPQAAWHANRDWNQSTDHEMDSARPGARSKCFQGHPQ